MVLSLTRNPKVIRKQPRRHPSWQRMDSPAACAMPTADESNHSAAGTLHQHIDVRNFTQLHRKVPIDWLQWDAPYLPQNCPSPLKISIPSNTPISRLTPRITPNSIEIQLAVFPQFTHRIDQQMG